MHCVKVALLLLAAGRGTRFGGEVPKAFLSLGGKTLLLRSAERLRQLCPMDQGELIVLVSAQDRATHLRPLTEPLAALGAHFVDGGDTRQQSMQNGLAAASKDCELVLIHDAARPLFPIAAARECLRRAAEVGAALLAIPSPDTLKRVNAHGLVEATIDRTGVFEMLTVNPRIRRLIAEGSDDKEIFAEALRTGMTDFRRAGLLKVAQGTTSLEELFRVIPAEHLGVEEE